MTCSRRNLACCYRPWLRPRTSRKSHRCRRNRSVRRLAGEGKRPEQTAGRSERRDAHGIPGGDASDRIRTGTGAACSAQARPRGNGDAPAGTLDVTIEGKTTRLTPGSVAYVASNELHGWKNPGADRAQYFVIALGQGL